jgi:hypothetical protein
MGALSDQLVTNAVGFAAAGLVLATFCMRSMWALRWIAVASNLTFIAYAYLVGLAPVLILHSLLLPVNAYRLTQLHCAAVRHNPAAQPGHLVSRDQRQRRDARQEVGR